MQRRNSSEGTMQTVTLIIDKRKELPAKYKKLLENEYSTVIITRDIISAMKFIQDKEPDLILISDSVDADLAGFCKKIRGLTYNMRPIIAAISKSAELDDKLKVLESGADDFISEPINSDEFTMRIKAHLRREFESNLDSKKLLPNKNYSMRALKRILSSNKEWACLYISIDNFENYREEYTKLASDKLAQTYTAIITSALSETDYLGSISEKEFLVITDAIKAEKIANFLTFAFDMVVEKFYSSQDVNRGYMIMQGENETGRRSDFVHTTIGIVTSQTKKYQDNFELITDLINIHNLAKMTGKSNYLIERTKLVGENSVCEKKYNNKILIMEPDESMTLLLSTILKIQGYEVINNDSEEIPAIMIIDAGDNESRKGLDKCKQIKADERYKNTKLIMTSSFHEKETILNAGADLYMPKPYEMVNLIKWVDTFMKEINFI